MGTTLTGTEIKDTYDSLIKVTDSGPISGTLKALSDGLGNDSSLSLSTTAASITGSLSLSSGLIFSAADFVIGANTSDGADNKASYLCGGTTQSTARGANIRVYGNEYTDQQGDLVMYSGNVANSEIQLRAQSSSSQILMYTNDAERLRITSTGNVGIGNTIPSSFLSNGNQLVVGSGAAAQGITIYSDTAGTGNLFFADGTAGDAAYRGFLRYNHADDSMQIYTAGANERMHIDSSGNVGIGTDAPISKLNINGGTGDTTANDTILSLTRTSSTSNVLAAKIVLTAPSTYQQYLNFRLKTTASSAEDPSYYTDIMRVTADGLCFGSDTAAANALDDYEEGTWTPTIEGTTTAGTANYVERIASYTKIGRIVHFAITMNYNSGTGTGDLRISNLPFTSANEFTSVTIGAFSNVSLTAGYAATSFIAKSVQAISFEQYPTGGGTSIPVPYDAEGIIFLTGSYSV